MNLCLKQGSAEWLALRKTKITSSDAAIIMEVNPWKTPYQLFLEKLDLSLPDEENDAMRWGKLKEEEARQCLEKKTELFFFPEVVFHSEHDFMMASLDGITFDKKIICELKCPRSYKPDLPNYYYAQIQHHLACSSAKCCYYFPYYKGDGEYIEVYPNKDYIDALIQKEQEFYQCLINRTPPPLTDRDYTLRLDDSWKIIAEKWMQLSVKIGQLEIEEKELRKQLIEMAGNQNAMGAGIKLAKIIRRGSVCYESIPELKGVDLNPYRKESVETFRIDLLNN